MNVEDLVQAVRGIENQTDIRDQTVGVDRPRTRKITESAKKSACRKCPVIKIYRAR